ncbi:hypothetical protein KBC79_01500 [Candidatus Woesebacteria bacterium]|nr:hypothetical protein [Candidatus Woesebacteria bacterium]
MQDITLKDLLLDLLLIIVINISFAVLMIEVLPRIAVRVGYQDAEMSISRQINEGGM